MRGWEEETRGKAIVLVLFSPWCHPATVVTSKFSWTAEEDSEEKKEEGRQAEEADEEEERTMEDSGRVVRERWCEEDGTMKAGR